MFPFELIPTVRQAYMTISYNSTPHFNVKHDYVKKMFFPPTTTEFNNLVSNSKS